MGLLYVFPVSLEEKDFVVVKDQTITLKTYGLPYLFWGYATAAIMVILFMFLAIKAPVLKLIMLGDGTDSMLGYSLLTFIGLLPVLILSAFFYEKRLIKTKRIISIEYRFFGVKIFSESFTAAEAGAFLVNPYLSSPTQARIQGGEDSVNFQNKGYFTLKLKTENGKMILIDRHSRKADLIKLEELLKTFD